jgi:hypothetical protein
MTRGPVEFVVMEFPDGVPGVQLGPELRALVDKGVVQLIDTLFIGKADDGTITSFEVADRPGDPNFEALDQVKQAIDGLISSQDIEAVGDMIAPGSTAALFLFEHVWVHQVREIVATAGGQVIVAERIPEPVVQAMKEAS